MSGAGKVGRPLAALLAAGLILTALACTEGGQKGSQAPPRSVVSYDPALPLVLEYGRGSCPWCVKMGPVLHELARDYEGRLNVSEVSVEEQAQLAKRAGILRLPTIIIYRPNGEEAYRHVGFWPKEEIIVKLRELGMVPGEETSHVREGADWHRLLPSGRPADPSRAGADRLGRA
jgi:thiol-disulfide isomerase/thioredoxin